MLNAAPAPIIEGRYFQDIAAQPQALRDTLAWLSQPGRWRELRQFLGARAWRRIVLTGMGSSFHGFHPLNLQLIAAGHAPVMMETSELIYYGLDLLDEHTLVIAASQSGASAEMVRLLELNRRATVIGVTNTAGSPLARGAHLALLAQAGAEYSVSCKTYVSGLLLLQWLAAVAGGNDEPRAIAQVQGAVDLVEQYLAGWRGKVESLAERLAGRRHLFLTGRGASLAAVATGALITKEATHVHAEGMSSAAFRHGPLEMVNDSMWIGVYGGDASTLALNRRLLRDLAAAGAHCDEIGPAATLPALRLPECSAALRPIVEILPVQLMTLALASLSGREAGRFERATKITDTE